MFESARLTLTLWYLLIILVISVSFSVILFGGISNEVEQAVQRQRQHVEFISRGTITIDPTLEQQLKNRVRLNMLFIDLFILMVAGVAGYLLAGKTLKPIERMVEEQKRFVSDASHELRTPLTALSTSIEVALRDPKLTLADAKEVLQSNLEDVQQLRELTDHLLDLARHQQTGEREPIEEVPLDDAIQAAIDRVKSLATEKEITIHPHLLPTRVKAHQSRITELFVILLDNAIKYSDPKKNINVYVEEKGHHVVATVKDQGRGIPHETVDKIFDRFYQVDKSRTSSDRKGYGLGLAIAKKIVTTYQGTINVRSKVNEGSEFIITFPIG